MYLHVVSLSSKLVLIPCVLGGHLTFQLLRSVLIDLMHCFCEMSKYADCEMT